MDLSNEEISKPLTNQTILNEHIQQQVELISVLKQQIIRLQIDLNNHAIDKSNLETELASVYQDNQSLLERIKLLTYNNESLLQTVHVFQREFINSSSALSKLPLDLNKNGAFHLQIVRNLKSKITNNFIEPSPKASQKSIFSQFYGFFLQDNSVEEQEVTLFNEIVDELKPIRASKIKSLGRKRFFSESFRHVFWFNSIENKLKINQRLYQILEDQYQSNIENKPPKSSIIDLDLRRMDIKLDDEKSKVVLLEIKHLLETFELYRPDIKYVQGMSYIAWIFLIKMSPYQAFSSFCNTILGDTFIYSLYMFEEHKIKKIVSFFQECLADKKPKLFKHMNNLCVQSELFLIQWAYTFYSRAFSLRLISKIWDLWISEGYNVFFKVAMTIFQILEPELLEQNENDKFIDIVRVNSAKIEENQFLKVLNKQKLFEDLKLE